MELITELPETLRQVDDGLAASMKSQVPCSFVTADVELKDELPDWVLIEQQMKVTDIPATSATSRIPDLDTPRPIR